MFSSSQDSVVLLPMSPSTDRGLRFEVSKALKEGNAIEMSREIQFLSRLTHPNIVEYIGTAVEPDHLHIVCFESIRI